jgi:hypothetical protein
MKRGLAPAFVIAQASAHSSPTLGNEFKVVNWLRAAAILTQIDPVSAGYLTTHTSGGFRLPALRKLADGLDLVAVGRTNPLAEHTLHKLSDVDFTFSIPAATSAASLIQELASRFDFSPGDANYNLRYRNPVFANLSQERLLIVYGNGGLATVWEELVKLGARGAF